MSEQKKVEKKVVKKTTPKAPKMVGDLQEVTLIKDHGQDEKGSKLLRHPKTAQLLIAKKIAQ